jgi:hypothetical protein
MMPMIVITISSSMSVKLRRACGGRMADGGMDRTPCPTRW